MIKIRESFHEFMRLKVVNTPSFQIRGEFEDIGKENEYFSIYKNPDKKEIGLMRGETKKLKNYKIKITDKEKNTIRAFLWNNDLYAWQSAFSIHLEVMSHITEYHDFETLPLQMTVNDSNEITEINLGAQVKATKFGNATKEFLTDYLKSMECIHEIIAPNVKYTLKVII